MNGQRLLPWAVGIAVLAVAYGEARQDQPDNPQAGVVARYARHVDYHDVFAERLKVLTAFVDQLGGPGTKSLWYTDTGPLLERDLAQHGQFGGAPGRRGQVRRRRSRRGHIS